MSDTYSGTIRAGIVDAGQDPGGLARKLGLSVYEVLVSDDGAPAPGFEYLDGRAPAADAESEEAGIAALPYPPARALEELGAF